MLKVRCFHLIQFTMNLVLNITAVCLLYSVIDFHFGRLVLEIIATLVKSSEICFFYSSGHFLTIIFIVMGQTTCDCCFVCIILNAFTVHHRVISSNSTMSKRHLVIIIVIIIIIIVQ